MDLKNTNKAIDKFITKLNSQARKKLTGSKSSGKLYNSFKLSTSNDEDIPDIQVSMEDYGKYVDEGRKPGKGIPVNDLKKWINKKGLKLTGSDGSSLPMTDSRVNSLAYVINKKIKEKGIKPTNFLTDPLNILIKTFSNDVANAYGDDILGDIFNDLD